MIPRIIARLDIKNSNLVKGIHLEGFRSIGDPMEFSLKYYSDKADEIMFQDVVASLYERNQLLDLVKKVANNIFIPITVGGGIRTLKDIENLLISGADKVSINTQAIRNPNFISEAAKTFGSSTISVAIETIKDNSGKYYVYSESGREQSGIELFSWVNTMQDTGAGELLITSVDNEGTGRGYDIDLMLEVNNVAKVPLIAHGGGGSSDDVLKLISKAKVEGVMVASMIHYDALSKISDHKFKKYQGNTAFLNNEFDHSLHMQSIFEIKEKLKKNNIDVR